MTFPLGLIQCSLRFFFSWMYNIKSCIEIYRIRHLNQSFFFRKTRTTGKAETMEMFKNGLSNFRFKPINQIKIKSTLLSVHINDRKLSFGSLKLISSPNALLTATMAPQTPTKLKQKTSNNDCSDLINFGQLQTDFEMMKTSCS